MNQNVLLFARIFEFDILICQSLDFKSNKIIITQCAFKVHEQPFDSLYVCTRLQRMTLFGIVSIVFVKIILV